MSRAHAVKKMPAKSSQTILMPVISKALLEGDGTVVNSRGTKSEQFILGDGDNSFALHAHTSKGNGSNGRVQLSTGSVWDVEVTDGTLVIVENDEIKISVLAAPDRPLTIILDELLAEVAKWYTTVTAGLPDTVTLGKLMQGVTNPYN